MKTGTTGDLVRHRQTKGAATDRVDLEPPASHSDSTQPRRSARAHQGRESTLNGNSELRRRDIGWARKRLYVQWEHIRFHATAISAFDENLTAHRPRNGTKAKSTLIPVSVHERPGASVLCHSRGAGLRHRKRVRFEARIPPVKRRRGSLRDRLLLRSPRYRAGGGQPRCSAMLGSRLTAPSSGGKRVRDEPCGGCRRYPRADAGTQEENRQDGRVLPADR